MRREHSSWHRASLAAALFLALGAVALGQSGAPAASGAGAETWTPRLTPWGDPDLQGNFTNKDETAPFERRWISRETTRR